MRLELEVDGEDYRTVGRLSARIWNAAGFDGAATERCRREDEEVTAAGRTRSTRRLRVRRAAGFDDEEDTRRRWLG
ncbi:hypothetical protein Csa_020420 [Cucumis sativus]|uniref:Uncharacterized protein n=1 Tax=Cucumis sativus TaxID=3659 RepID=A0A0A0K1K2_CUCSA|nr:hypothetical protein Csa_020420 [Cucumis sativus]